MKDSLEAIYACVPKIKCIGKCGDLHDGCCGPVGACREEAVRMDGYNGVTSPWVATNSGDVVMNPTALFEASGSRNCPHLGLGGTCTVYEVRPLVCRIWGVVKQLKCPWGCQPERWLGPNDALRLFERVAAVQADLDKNSGIAKALFPDA